MVFSKMIKINLLKASIKAFLPKFLFYKKKHKSIAIIGTRRGATTYLQGLFIDNSTRSIDQPFEHFPRKYWSRTVNFKKKEIPSRDLNQLFDFEDNDINHLKTYLKYFENGKYAFIDQNFGFSKNRIVYKFTEGSYFIDQFSELKIFPIIIFRHPIGQAFSCMRNKWGHIYYPYMNSSFFIREFLDTPNKINLFLNIDKFGTELEKRILDWYCSNAYLLKVYQNYVTLFYENLVLDPITEIKKIPKEYMEYVDLNKLNKPSGSSYLSENDFKSKIGDKGYKKKHLAKPFQKLNSLEKRKIDRIFAILEIKIYNAFDASLNLTNN